MMEIRSPRDHEFAHLAAMTSQAYNTTSREQSLREALDGEILLRASDDDVAAIVRTCVVGQFFGGRSVSTADVRNVVVAAHHRSRGHLRHLLRESLLRRRSEGLALSTLTPSTVPAYRRFGYEYAGTMIRYRAPVSAAVAHHGDTVQEWGRDQLAEVADCYRRFAQRNNGLLDRSAAWWDEFVLSDQGQHRYLLRRDGAVTGYLVYTQERAPGDLPYYYRLQCNDLVWTDEESARSLLGFIAGNRALATEFEWYGPQEEPLTLFFDEDQARRQLSRTWMIRLLDPEKAFQERGWPGGLTGRIAFDVEDDYLEVPRHTFTVEWSDGEAIVKTTDGRGAPLVDLGTLGSIYAGWLRASDAAALGRMPGFAADDLDLLDAAFAGQPAWAMDVV